MKIGEGRVRKDKRIGKMKWEDRERKGKEEHGGLGNLLKYFL